MDYEKINGLILPKTPIEDLPRFTVRHFLCHYEQDVVKFQNLVTSKGGYWENALQIAFTNCWNRKIGYQYCVIYHYFEDIDMEVLC